MKPQGLKKLSMGGSLGEYGSKESGFAGAGPFSCSMCAHKKNVKQQMVCLHPSVNEDPDLKDRDRADGFVVVDHDDCCRYVRPAEN